MSMRYVGGLVTTTVNPYAANVTTSPNYAQYNGVFTLAQQAQASTSGQWCTDPFFDYTTLLLRADGVANGSQNNTFLDSSTNNFTITRNGNTTQGTFSPYGSLWSNYFDGSGDYLTAPNNTAFAFGTGDFTIESWINTTSTSFQQIVGTEWSGANQTGKWILAMSETVPGIVKLYGWNTPIISTTSAVNDGKWHNITVSRQGTTLRMFVDGVLESTVTSSFNFLVPNGTLLYVGGYYDPGVTLISFNGYISNVRIVKGAALYTSNFTPSTTPLTAVSGTSLLTCQSNRFIDNSSNNFTLTVNGDTSVQRFSPFNPTAPYSASTIGGSGYFDGTTDYLTLPTNTELAFGTGDFTVSFWLYPNAWANGTTASTCILHGGNSAFQFSQYGATTMGIACADVAWVITNVPLPPIGTWSYVVATRVSGTTKVYVNGVRSGSSASDGRNYTQITRIGAYTTQYTPNDYYNGYMCDLRVVKGIGVTSVTVPTAPLTAVSGTSLLLNFTNAGIPDAAMMNDLETVGNAQVSTSVVKYGSGSLAFDGSGDWLNSPNSIQYDFGSGDFTIEFWIYFNSVSGTVGVLGKRASEANYAPYSIEMTSSALKLYMSTSGSSWAVNGLSTSTLSTSAWYHLAVTRSGNTVYMFLNGTSVGSTGTVSGALMTNTSSLFIGANSGSPSGAAPLNGYIDDLRITKGIARYVTNFTPPPVALQVQ